MDGLLQLQEAVVFHLSSFIFHPSSFILHLSFFILSPQSSTYGTYSARAMPCLMAVSATARATA